MEQVLIKVFLALLLAALFLTACTVPKQQIWQKSASVEVIDQANFEPLLLELINERRQELGLTTLVTNTLLSEVAEAHSLDMADNNYLAHENLVGIHAGERITIGGYRWKYWGEVLAGGTASPQETFDGWMGSPLHKAVILDPVYEEIGAGFSYDNTTYHHNYWCVLLAIPKGAK